MASSRARGAGVIEHLRRIAARSSCAVGVEDVGPNAATTSAKPFGTRGHRIARGDVGVDDRDAESRERVGDLALARGDATGQANV